MEVYKFLPKVRGGAQRAEGSVVLGQLLYCYLQINSWCEMILDSRKEAQRHAPTGQQHQAQGK